MQELGCSKKKDLEIPIKGAEVMFDYHVHTSFSADSHMPMKAACDAAVGKGIEEIAFTEHLDIIYPDSDLKWDFDYEEYNKEVRHLKKTFKNRLTIVRGVEVGLHPSGYEAASAFIDRGGFDFVIGSVHVVDDKDLHEGAFFQKRTLNQAIYDYFCCLNQQVKDFDNFNVLGHLDLVKRYLKYLNCSAAEVRWQDYFPVIEDTLKALIESGRGIEVNMSGYRYGLGCSLPGRDVIKLYYDLGGEIITVGSDAHYEECVGLSIDKGVSLLKEIGFKYVTTFKERKPIFNRI